MLCESRRRWHYQDKNAYIYIYIPTARGDYIFSIFFMKDISHLSLTGNLFPFNNQKDTFHKKVEKRKKKKRKSDAQGSSTHPQAVA